MIEHRVIVGSREVCVLSAFVVMQQISFKEGVRSRRVFELNFHLGSYAMILAHQIRNWNGGGYINVSQTTNSIYVHTKMGIVRLSDHLENPARNPLRDNITFIVTLETRLGDIIYRLEQH